MTRNFDQNNVIFMFSFESNAVCPLCRCLYKVVTLKVEIRGRSQRLKAQSIRNIQPSRLKGSQG